MATKQPITSDSNRPLPLQAQSESLDTATLALFASWRQQDATLDFEQIRAADRELAEFKKAMNENREPAGQPLLDSGPLGLLSHPQRSAEVAAVTDWLSHSLDAFITATPGRYLPLSDAALRLAADLWAKSSQSGQSTADPKALDVHVIFAALVGTNCSLFAAFVWNRLRHGFFP